MKVPLSWLRDYVELPPSVADLAERLTLAGLEVAGVRVLGLPVPEGLRVKDEDRGPVWDRARIVVGRVLGVERHPNADRLTLATVDYGAGQPKTVVTGAPNLKVGDRGQGVIVALAGSLLFDGHASDKVLKELKPSKIRGVPSDAMVCSAYELGISDEHEGIILLDEDVAPGTPLADFMGEIVLDLDVLPNMARCLSMVGVAREVAALTGKILRLPPHAVQAAGEPIQGKVQVAIEDPKLSARYAAGLLQGVRVGRAPGWMQRRLTYAGMRPISNVVDITNYVMLEWGQPLHAFDYDKLVQRAGGKSPVITVRPARAGEKLTTLDGVTRELTADNLMIADQAGPVAIAGVMGGAATEVSEATANILLESANFDFVSIRRTMKALNLPSEASVRFSKGIHAELVRPAAERAMSLMHEHAGATVCQGLADAYPRPITPRVITLERAEVRRVLGMDFDMAEMVRTLRALEFHVAQAAPETLRVTVPPHRLDIQAGSADLIEELARVHGYDRLPATLLADQLPEQHGNRALVLEERVRDILVNAGLQEVITYALTEPGREAPLGLPALDYVRLVNPISSERVVMRHSLLGGVLEVAAANLRHTEDVRLFEVGSIYLARPGEKLPDEPRRLALFLTGRRRPEFWGDGAAKEVAGLDFFDLKGAIEALVHDLHIGEVAYQPASPAYLQPGRAAELLVRGQPVGGFGQVHPKAAEAYGLGDRVVLVGELDLEAILAAAPARFPYSPVSRYPAALRDIAVVVDEGVSAERVAGEIRTAGGKLLAGLRLFDVYRGDSIPAGTKSLAYALTYQADDRTLIDQEVDKAHKKIEDRLRHVLKAQVRGEDTASS
ncbi:MAG TPA: phenylalanine--tRNA ligase subunit beta [Gemmataceae bacterium]|nr:phenylalanine--tRNA ligase subunit beta [Gemmataceae bacterium]